MDPATRRRRIKYVIWFLALITGILAVALVGIEEWFGGK
jgi:hypothetical protein